MKHITIASLLILSSSAFAADQNPEKLYIHAFRAPSTGLEYRTGRIGVHAGVYTTILGRGEKSTEFFKLGATYYYRLSNKRQFERFESYFSIGYVRGLNRDYSKKDGAFFESGFLYELGKGFEVRLGTGMLVAKGFRPEFNPTIGFSYSVPIR